MSELPLPVEGIHKALRVNFCTGRIRSADPPLFSGAAKKRRQNAPSGVVGLFTPDAATIAAGANYLRGYIFDCMFAGIHFCFSGYFCACGKSGLSFLCTASSPLCSSVSRARI